MATTSRPTATTPPIVEPLLLQGIDYSLDHPRTHTFQVPLCRHRLTNTIVILYSRRRVRHSSYSDRCRNRGGRHGDSADLGGSESHLAYGGNMIQSTGSVGVEQRGNVLVATMSNPRWR